MAYKLILPRPYQTLTHIWNVSDRVGDLAVCKNNPTDVDLVALLIGAYIFKVVETKHMHPDCKTPFLVNGKMDINIAYWIRVVNRTHHNRRLKFDDEGIISRAKRATYGTGTWSIVGLNLAIKKHHPDLYERFPHHAQCPPALKQELLDKTSP